MQNSQKQAVDANSGERAKAPIKSSAMLCVDDVAALLCCSARHVYRLVDMGRMPRPVKLGWLVRWSRETIEHWIAEGCPSRRKGGNGYEWQ